MIKNISKNISKILSVSCNQKLFDDAKQSNIDALKTILKGTIEKTAEQTSYEIGNW